MFLNNLNATEKAITRNYIQRNAFFTHSGKILLLIFKFAPPFISTLPDNQLVQIFDHTLQVHKWPNNTQAVARGDIIKTESFAAVATMIEREDYICQRIHSKIDP